MNKSALRQSQTKTSNLESSPDLIDEFVTVCLPGGIDSSHFLKHFQKERLATTHRNNGRSKKYLRSSISNNSQEYTEKTFMFNFDLLLLFRDKHLIKVKGWGEERRKDEERECMGSVYHWLVNKRKKVQSTIFPGVFYNKLWITNFSLPSCIFY